MEVKGINLREELDKMAVSMITWIGEEQVAAVLYDEERDNQEIKRKFRQVLSLLSFSVSDVTAQHE